MGKTFSADLDERDIHIVWPENHADRAVCREVSYRRRCRARHFTLRSQSEIEIFWEVIAAAERSGSRIISRS